MIGEVAAGAALVGALLVEHPAAAAFGADDETALDKLIGEALPPDRAGRRVIAHVEHQA